MVQYDEVYVAVTKVDGGYILSTKNGQQVITSLNKVMKTIKYVLEPELKVIPE